MKWFCSYHWIWKTFLFSLLEDEMILFQQVLSNCLNCIESKELFETFSSESEDKKKMRATFWKEIDHLAIQLTQ